jgi:hypothetical protein
MQRPVRFCSRDSSGCPHVTSPGLASEPPTWLQTENSKYPVQMAVVAGGCQRDNLINFGPDNSRPERNAAALLQTIAAGFAWT